MLIVHYHLKGQHDYDKINDTCSSILQPLPALHAVTADSTGVLCTFLYLFPLLIFQKLLFIFFFWPAYKANISKAYTDNIGLQLRPTPL